MGAHRRLISYSIGTLPLTVRDLRRMIEALPEEAAVVNFYNRCDFETFLLLSHSDFPEVPTGHAIRNVNLSKILTGETDWFGYSCGPNELDRGTTKMFKVGDVVQLKSGGPLMTVSECDGHEVTVVWFKDDEQKFAVCKPETLKKHDR